MKKTVLQIVVGFVFVMFVNSTYGALLGVRYSGLRTSPDIIRIDEITHSVSVLASSGTIWMNSLARDKQGMFWTTAPSIEGGSFDRRLISIHPVTGKATTGPLLVGGAGYATDFDAIAFSPNNVLYGIDLNDKLVTIDTQTGATSLIGRVGQLGQPIGIQGLAFTPNGTLYGWGVERYGLIRINPTNATFVDVNTSAGPSDVQALAAAADGTLYGARDSLYIVNTTTGTLSTVMTGLGDVRGIDFIIPLIPEPTSSSLACIAFAYLLLERNRRFA